MRMPPLPADSIHARACKLKCEKILTRPQGISPGYTNVSEGRPTLLGRPCFLKRFLDIQRKISTVQRIRDLARAASDMLIKIGAGNETLIHYQSRAFLLFKDMCS